jgi:enoyl-CoA hydratase
MEYKNLLLEKDQGLAIVTVNRPKALNALNDQTVSELLDLFAKLSADTEVRVIILTGAGEKAFIAGADIGELKICDAEKGAEKSRRGHQLMHLIEGMPKVVIAAVNGFALGGGCEIAMACDIRLVSENARLGQPEVSLGVIPGYGGTQRLARLVGKGKAKQLIFTGDLIDAKEAYRIGLVEEVYPQAELLDKAREMAGRILSKGPLAIVAAKRCINDGLEKNLVSGCEEEIAEFGKIFGTEDRTEGTTAFLEKRKPEFKGR